MNKNKLNILKNIMFKEFLCLKTKQNTEMSDEEHSFIILKSKKRQREKLVAVVGILTKLKQAEISV